jgi:hypothetical protein
MAVSPPSLDDKVSNDKQHVHTSDFQPPQPGGTTSTNRTDPEKSFARLTPIPSSTSTVEEAIDAEAGFTNVPPTQSAGVKTADGDDPGPPPNGGFQAWLQVAGSFFLFFNCWYVKTLNSRTRMVAAWVVYEVD